MNGIVSVVMISWRFTYLCWNIPIRARIVFNAKANWNGSTIDRARALIVLALMSSLASCQSGQSGGNATSKADITDPNTAFSKGGAQTSTANGTTSGVSPRRGGLLPGSDADSQGR
jgi:hypothetical protein